jgi:hypothetical protein
VPSLHMVQELGVAWCFSAIIARSARIRGRAAGESGRPHAASALTLQAPGVPRFRPLSPNGRNRLLNDVESALADGCRKGTPRRCAVGERVTIRVLGVANRDHATGWTYLYAIAVRHAASRLAPAKQLGVILGSGHRLITPQKQEFI